MTVLIPVRGSYDYVADALNRGGSINFPALKNITGDLRITGSVRRMSFPALTEVAGDLTITKSPEDLERFSYDSISSTSYDLSFPIVLDCPSLVSCSFLMIAGNISSISMPVLSSLSTSQQRFDKTDLRGRMIIYTIGEPLQLSLPSLLNASSVTMVGTFENISLPSLLRVEDEYYIKPYLPMKVDTYPLQSTDRFTLDGRLTSYDISSVTDVDDLYINTSPADFPRVDCSPAKKKWQEIHPEDKDLDDPLSNFFCKGRSKSKSIGLPVGLGVGLGVSLIGLLALLAFCIWRRKGWKRKTAKEQLPDYETEMDTRRTGGGEVLPKYALPPHEQGNGAHSNSAVHTGT
ncbi:hypothetical protein ONS95_004172 [Cadophora gregata]|uniref:uncharacterized protein n=1 Tax=Cadophora gregata TaxID=51156 RepID=UPI0026DB5163|nr:uncharacterized protein ONS95_004172 [Cadophora gregata]KAK0105644.1 hypothetical protein ONS95_004172 [Cadophora gregata]